MKALQRKFLAALLALSLLAGLLPATGTTAQAAVAVIGETVNFAGHEWYIIGTPSEGVTAPAGCYTLFAKNNDFGTSKGPRESFRDSELNQKLSEIYGEFSSNTSDIEMRTLTASDGIMGDEVAKALWPLSEEEFNSLKNQAVFENKLAFENVNYWLRDSQQRGSGYSARYVSYVTGDLGWSAPDQHDNNIFAIRPALYVKQEAVTFVGAFYVGADTITSASVGGNLVANAGQGVPLLTDSSLVANVLVESGDKSQSGASLTFSLRELDTSSGANQVVACVLTDSTGAVKYYGKLADLSKAFSVSRDLSVPLTGVADGTYTLSIFAHNTAAGTISAPTPTMTVTVQNGVGTVSNYQGGEYIGIDVGYLAFTEQPQSLEVKLSDTATFTAKAANSSGNDDGVTYTWEVQSPDEQGGWYAIQDADSGQNYNSSSITFTDLTGTWAENGFSLEIVSYPDRDYKISNGLRIRCQAKSQSPYAAATSTIAKLTVDQNPVFATQPQDVTAEAGGSTSFSAEAVGIGGVTYTWQTQPKTSDPEHNMWYDIYTWPKGDFVVNMLYQGPNLYFPDASGSWKDNEKVWSDGSGFVYNSSFDPAEARFRCVAKDGSGRVIYSEPAELTVTGGTTPEPAAVTAIAGYGGSIDQSTFTATADEGFVIDQLWVDGVEITAASGQTTYTPDDPQSSVFVTFAYTVEIATPENGTLTVTRSGASLTSGSLVRPGDVLEITATPASGYTLESLSVNGASVTPQDGVYTYTVGSQPTQTRSVGDATVAAAGAAIAANFSEEVSPPDEEPDDQPVTPPEEDPDDPSVTPPEDPSDPDEPSEPSEPADPGDSDEPDGPATTDSAGWRDIQDEIASAEDGDTIVVDMNGSTEVPQEILETVQGKDVDVVFELEGDVSWTVNGADIPKDADLSDLDLGVTMDTDGIPVDVINTITGEVGTVQITLAHDGDFGFAMTMTAPLGKENAGYWANLYHYDEDAEAMTFETAAEIDGDGRAQLKMHHASQYAIVIDDHSHAALSVSDIFVDVAPDAWYTDAVQYAYDHGLMTGTSATTFAPDATTTRAMIVSILARQENVTSAEDAGFTDVAENDWYATAVNWAAREGIVAGFEDDSFRPNEAITREQLAAILCNYSAWKGEDTSARADLDEYTDAISISFWATDTMSWAVAEQLLAGVTENTLEPQGAATRAQVAAVLQRFLSE